MERLDLKERAQWSKTYWQICVCNMLLFMSFQMLLPTLPVYLADSGADKSAAGIVTGTLMLSAVLVRLFTGFLMNRFNHRLIVVIGTLILATAALSYSFSSQAGWSILASVLLGTGWGIMTVAYTSIVSELIPRERQGSGIGTFMIFVMISMALGPYFGGWIYNEAGKTALFGTASAIAVISILLFLFSGTGTRRSDEGMTSSSPEQAPFIRTLVESTSLFPSLLILLFAFGYGGLISFAGVFGQTLGVGNSGLFFLVSSLSAVLIRPYAGKRFDRRGPTAVILPGILIGLASFLLLTAASTVFWFITASVLYGLSFGLVQPYLLAWTLQRARPERRGAASSTFLIGMDGGIALGSFLLGMLFPLLGFAGTFAAASALMILLLACYSIGVLPLHQTSGKQNDFT